MNPDAWLLALVALAAGTALGTLTGLIPGVHVNTIAPLVLGVALAAGPAYALPAAILILTVATVHTILNVIPTLAAPLPDDDTALTLLPLQRLAKNGHAHTALRVSVRASWFGGLLASTLLLALLLLLPAGASMVPHRLAIWAVLTVLMMLIMKHSRPFRALATFLLAGTAGLILLDTSTPGPLGGDGTILLPAFAGLYGTPLLLMTLVEKTNDAAVPPQHPDHDQRPATTVDTHVPPAPASRFAGPLGTFCGLLVALFPGLTSATAGAVGRAVRQPDGDLDDVAMLSAIDTANVIGNTGALIVWGATRSGAGAAMGTVAPGIVDADAGHAAAWILGSGIVAVGLGALVAHSVGPGLVTRLRRVPAQPMAFGALFLLALIVVLHGGIVGFLVAASLVPLGLLPHRWGTPRALLMGFLLLPYLISAVPTS